MKAPKALLLLIVMLAAAASAAEPGSERRWVGPDGAVLPFRTDEEALDFLRSAEVVASERIHKGVGGARKLLLERGGIRAHAVFRTVDKRVPSGERRGWRRYTSFRDHYGFECAAYELGRLLGIDRIPPVVERRHKGRRGSLQLWIENAIDDETRQRRNLEPPDRVRWSRQMKSMRLFDALIQNDDRNMGNLLIDDQWGFWLIDHTRTFVPDRALRDPERLTLCPRGLWERLRGLDRAAVEERLSPYLTLPELSALFDRWDRLVAHFEARIEAQGEEAVLMDE